MSSLELLRNTIKKTDEKVQDFPKRYYFGLPLLFAVVISNYVYLSNPLLHTWHLDSLVASITMASLAFCYFLTSFLQ